MDDLALMTQRGFAGMEERFTNVDKRFDVMDDRFDTMDERLDRIEHLLIGSHDRRIEKTEDDIRIIKTLLEKKLSASFSR